MQEKVLRSNTFSIQSKQSLMCSQKMNGDLLPTEISGKILDLEVQIERNDFPKQMVTQLISAYSAAIQFYQEKNNPKYKLYQKRMKDFMHKPIIYSMMKGQENIQTIKRSQVHKQQVLKAQYRVKEQVNKIMTYTNQKANKQKKKINQSIQDQQSSLKKRMENRRIRSNNNSAIEDVQVNGQIIKLEKLQNIKLEIHHRSNIRKPYI